MDNIYISSMNILTNAFEVNGQFKVLYNVIYLLKTKVLGKKVAVILFFQLILLSNTNKGNKVVT